MRLISRAQQGAAIQGVQITNMEAQRVSRLLITPDLPGPCTISTAEPVRRGPGSHAFEVSMPVKGARTAVGYMAEPSTRYMTPDYLPKGYVSMGGAGFIYPASRQSGSSYGEGDTVRVELDWDAGEVRFAVNGRAAGKAAWTGSDVAFPAVSMHPGQLELLVTFADA